MRFDMRHRLTAGVAAASAVAIPPTHGFHSFLSTLARSVTDDGCGTGGTCPDSAVTRGQMARVLVASRERSGYAPPACVSPRFADVPCRHPFAPWIEALAKGGVTAGCGGANYCPERLASREEIAVLLLRTREGPGFAPPPCSAAAFGDVPCSSPYAPWINELAARSITEGCGGGRYCPLAAVTHKQASSLLLATLGPN